MDSRRPKVSESMSSNDALIRNIQRINRHNNAAFRTLVIKKRGVYVERKPTKESLSSVKNMANAATATNETAKAPPRPVRGKKRFLSSVFNLLSKSSAGTQWPENAAAKTKIKRKKAVKKTDLSSDQLNGNPPEITTELEIEGKKKKYKSRVLNGISHEFDKFEVLQAKKDIIHTPSVINSETSGENIKWSEFLPRLVQPDQDEINLEKEKKLSHLVREVNEGRRNKESNVKIEDPATLVSEQNDKGLYNFFVDLLETTFSVYNIKGNHCKTPNVIKSTASSKISLKIDESVANKLKVVTEKETFSVTPTLSKRYSYLPNTREKFNDDKVPPSKSRQPRQVTPVRTPLKRQMNSESLAYMKYDNLMPYSKSTLSSKKSSYKEDRKRNFLNLIKEQLRMEPYEEPQNLHEALKVIVRNKRKSEKTLRFDTSTKEKYNLKCVTFKNHSVTPNPKTKHDNLSYLQNNRSFPKPPDFGNRKFALNDSEDELSSHSLEVYNMNYDSIVTKTDRKKLKQTRASPTESELDYINYKPRDDPQMNRLIMTLEDICRHKKSIPTS